VKLRITLYNLYVKMEVRSISAYIEFIHATAHPTRLADNNEPRPRRISKRPSGWEEFIH